MDAPPCTIITPHAKIVVDRLPGRIVFGQHPPLDATHEDGEDGIDHLARIDGTWATAGLRGRNEIFDTIPLAVGEIGRVGLVLHTPRVPESSS